MPGRPPDLCIVNAPDYRRSGWQIVGIGCKFRRLWYTIGRSASGVIRRNGDFKPFFAY
jgi:hypothetical protein